MPLTPSQISRLSSGVVPSFILFRFSSTITLQVINTKKPYRFSARCLWHAKKSGILDIPTSTCRSPGPPLLAQWFAI